MTSLNEGFRRYTDHLDATDPQPFRDAASVIDAGGTIGEALSLLSPQHLTSLFHIKSRPPFPMLVDAGRKGASKILRNLAQDLNGKGA